MTNSSLELGGSDRAIKIVQETRYNMKTNIDAIDEKILELLQKNARISIKDIAAQVFLSSPAVTARIERLEKNNIILGYHASIDSTSMGYKIRAFINLDLDPIRKSEFYPFVNDVVNVVSCNCVTGEYSILMEVGFADTTELDGFINELQRFGKTRTQIVFSTAVEHRSIPIKAGTEEKLENDF